MRIAYFTVYGNMPGSMAVTLSDETDIKINFTEEEAQELRGLAQRIYEARQAAIARAAAQPFPALAHYTEVPY